MNWGKRSNAAQFAKRLIAGGLALAIIVSLIAVQTWRHLPFDWLGIGQNSSSPEVGMTAIQNEDWNKAIRFYGAAVERDDMDGLAWFFLGYSLHAAGRLDEAVNAHQRASRFPQFRSTALYNLACAYALQKRPADAIRALELAVDSGFRSTVNVADDPDFASLRTDARFIELADRATSSTASSARRRRTDGSRSIPALPADWQPEAEVVAPY